MSGPSDEHDMGRSASDDGSPLGHSWWLMVVCCIPMVVVIVLVALAR